MRTNPPDTAMHATRPCPGVLALLVLAALLARGADARGADSAPVLFVSRNPVPAAASGGEAALPGFGPAHRTRAVGGKLMVYSPGGRVRPLLPAGRLYDVADPSVSWDGRTVVFAAVEHPDSCWRVWRVGADGRGLRRLTHSDRAADLAQFGAAAERFRRYDDFDPCFLPDGRIIFASTRYPSIASLYGVPTSNLFVMTAGGDSLRRITTERNGAEEPAVDPVTGRVVYARWWLNLDRPSNATGHNLAREDGLALTRDIGNIWHAVTITPDGNELKLYAGFPRTRAGTQTYKPAVAADGRLLSVFTERPDLHPGSGALGIRWFRKGADVEHPVLGARPGGPPGAQATDPYPLAGDEILLSYAPTGEDFGVYRCRLDGGGLVRVADLPGTHELEPQLLAPRPRPPVIPDQSLYRALAVPPTEDPQTHLRDDTFRFDCMNVFTNGAVDEPIPDAPRIARDVTIRFFMNVQRQSTATPDPSIHVKDAPVFYNGGVHEHDMPAEVPMFEQLVDAHGKVLASPGGAFAHVTGFNFERQGSGTKCVGCHAGHTLLEVPVNGLAAEWFNAATSAAVTATSAWPEPAGSRPRAERVVDRQARTGGDTVYWAATDGGAQGVRLAWSIPLEFRELVLYAVSRDASQGTTSDILDCEYVLTRGGREVARVASTGPVAPSGTRVRVEPVVADALEVTVRRFTGTIRGREVAGLAEVETIARIHQDTR